MHDSEEEDRRRLEETPDRALRFVPPLRLAGIDEDDTWEPHVVRGID
ncbi:hypothetical protein [Streptomyces sp. NPDC050535]